MLLIAIVVTQILDPLRILLVGIAYFLSLRARRPGLGWLGLLVAIALIAALFPFVILGQSGAIGWVSAAVGVISNALVAGALAGLLRLQRRFFS